MSGTRTRESFLADHMAAKLEQRGAAIQQAILWLAEKGDHSAGCVDLLVNSEYTGDCICGLDALLAELRRVRAESAKEIAELQRGRNR